MIKLGKYDEQISFGISINNFHHTVIFLIEFYKWYIEITIKES